MSNQASLPVDSERLRDRRMAEEFAISLSGDHDGLRRAIWESENAMRCLQAEMDPLQASFSLHLARRKALVDALAAARLEAMGDIPDWPFLLDAANVERPVRRRLESELAKWGMHRCWKESGRGQVGIEIALVRRDAASRDLAIAGIKAIGPFLVPLDDGRIRFQVAKALEETQGVHLRVVPSDFRSSICWPSRSDGRATSLEEAMRVIGQDHWCWDGTAKPYKG